MRYSMKIEQAIPRVVFDTNILISALLSPRGASFQRLALARLTRIHSISCPQILSELQEKLLTKFGYVLEDAQRVVNEVEHFSEIVLLSGVAFPEVGDPNDWMVIECALVGRADCIVSGARHLLRSGRHGGIEILTARQFLQRLATETFSENGGQSP